MKPTLNEEIGMSQQGIDYVNSLEVKDEYVLIGDKIVNVSKLNISKEKGYLPGELNRIRKQARNAWICVFVIILLTVILNWK